MTLAPWISVAAPNFQEAMSAGAQAGLGAARNSLEQQQLQQQALAHAAQIGLGYAELASNRSLAAEKLRQAMDQAALLNQIREGNLEERKRGVDVQQQRADLASGQSAAEKLIHAGSGIYSYNPSTGTIRTLRDATAGLDPLAKFDLGQAASDLKSARALYNAAIASEDEEKVASAKAGLDAAQQKYDKVRGAIQSPAAASPGGPASPAPVVSPGDSLSQDMVPTTPGSDWLEPADAHTRPMLGASLSAPQSKGNIYMGSAEGEPTPTAVERIRVQAPDGSIGTIPADQLDAAKAQGYSEVQ